MNFKEFIKELVSSLIDVYGGIIGRIIRTRSPLKIRCGLLVPAWQGSLGDEAVITATCQYLRTNRNVELTLIGFDRDYPWKAIPLVDHRVAIPDYFKTGGWVERLRLAKLFCRLDEFFTLGTDMLDGHYTEWHTDGLLTISHQAACSGLQTNIIGFSLKSQPRRKAIVKLAKLSRMRNVTMCVRDPVSLDRFKAHVGQSAKLTADPAFLLEPDGAAHSLRNWMREAKKDGRLVIGVNLSSHVYDVLEPGEQESIIRSISQSLKEVANRYGQISVALIPHDVRINFSDIPLCEKIRERTSHYTSIAAAVMPPPYSAGVIKSLVEEVDVVLSSRMHLAIAALGVGIPVGCITYQGKFEGLFQHFKLADCTITPIEALNEEKLTAFLMRLIDGRKQNGKVISNAWPHIRKLAEYNYEFKK